MEPGDFSRTRTRYTAWTLTLVFGAVLVFAALRGAQPVGRAEQAPAEAALTDGRVPGGTLLLAGGGCVTSDIRRRFVELAGGDDARIVVIPATDPPTAEIER